MRTHRAWANFLLMLLLSLSLAACFGGHGGGGGGGGNGGGGGGNGGGGGGNGGGGGGGGAASVTIIEPTVSGAQVVAGSTLDFIAKVKGGNGTGVSWGVQSGDTCTNNNGMSSLGVVGGAGNIGTMPATTTNQAVATYSAPSVSALGGSAFITVTVTALQSPAATGPCLVVFVVATDNVAFNFNYVFRLRGFSSSPSGLPFGVIGRFFADGTGNIVNGFEDVNIAQADGSSVAFPKVAFTGTYKMDSTTHGTMKLTVTSPPWAGSPPTNPPPTTMNFSLTLALDGTFGGLIETDGAATPAYVGSGDFQFQGNSANFTTAKIVNFYTLSLAGPAGTGVNAANKGFIGRIDLTATSATAGTIVADAANSVGDDQSGAHPSQTLTGSYAIDADTSGHATLKITASAGMTNTSYTISFYIGNPRFFYALRVDNNVAAATPDGILLGTVNRLPATPPFTNTSVGSFLFEMVGITDSHSANGQGHATAAAGVLVGGAGTGPPTFGLFQGEMDVNDGGSVPNSLPIAINSNSSTFTIAPNGRGVASIAVNGVTYKFVFYLNGQGGGFLLEQPASDGSNRGRSGGFFPQTVTSGPSGTLVASTDVATAKSQNALAVMPITVSGSSGNFHNATQDISNLGSAATLGSALAGTFTGADANNRGTITVTTGSFAGSATATYYLASDTEAIVIGTDGNNTEPQILLLTNSLPLNR